MSRFKLHFIALAAALSMTALVAGCEQTEATEVVR
jgi:hypothetical protein